MCICDNIMRKFSVNAPPIDRRPGLADEYERLVLGDVASELGVDNPLQTLELFAHVHRLHAEVVPQIRMKLAYC